MGLQKIKINSRAFVKIYKIYESCETLEQMDTFADWLHRLFMAGILSEQDLLYFDSRINNYAKGYKHGLVDRKALE